MSDVIDRAAQFAKSAHESIDQRRKYSGEPYIVHPAAVAGLVSSVTDDEATIAAAWLHDVVEDTPRTIADIECEFGPEIAQLVSDLTDVSRPSDGNRRKRAALDRQHTAGADPRAKTVKLADVIHNLSDIVESDPRYAPTYIAEKAQLLKVLSDGHPKLYRRAEQVIQDSRARLTEK